MIKEKELIDKYGKRTNFEDIQPGDSISVYGLLVERGVVVQTDKDSLVIKTGDGRQTTWRDEKNAIKYYFKSKRPNFVMIGDEPLFFMKTGISHKCTLLSVENLRKALPEIKQYIKKIEEGEL